MFTEDFCTCDCITCSAPRSEEVLQKFDGNLLSHEWTLTMAEWSRLCSHIATSILPNRLKLCVTCNTDDVEVAKEFLCPLMNVPQLRQCSINLGGHKYHEMEQLAADTAFKLTRQSTGQIERPFRFMDLPEEIRLQILTHTDLVSFWDLAWLPRGVSMARQVLEYHAVNQFEDDMFPCCRHCSDIMETCYCWTRYAAASTTCSCWKLPTELFLISKRLGEHATEIFFSKNTFVILPEKKRNHDTPLEVYQFLTSIPELGRQSIRYEHWGSHHFFYLGMS